MRKTADDVFIRTLLKRANEEIEEKERTVLTEAVPVWWELDKKLRAEGKLHDGQQLSFFCPVYFAGQRIVKLFLDRKDEHGEMVVFSLPSITNPERIKVGLEQMHRLGIEEPEKYIEDKDGKKALPLYSALPGIEGVGSGRLYPWIGWEAVMLTAFQIVPDDWVNAGDPYTESYKFPGEAGYSPYWRIPPPEEFKEMRSDLYSNFTQKEDGTWIKTPPEEKEDE